MIWMTKSFNLFQTKQVFLESIYITLVPVIFLAGVFKIHRGHWNGIGVMMKLWWPITNSFSIRGERIVFWWPNTNTNIIQLFKNDRIRIRILFGLKKATEYEYEYYSGWKNHPNTNTNIIRFEKINRIRIRILFGLKILTEYEYEY